MLHSRDRAHTAELAAKGAKVRQVAAELADAAQVDALLADLAATGPAIDISSTTGRDGPAVPRAGLRSAGSMSWLRGPAVSPSGGDAPAGSGDQAEDARGKQPGGSRHRHDFGPYRNVVNEIV